VDAEAIHAAKAALRARLLARRSALGADERARASLLICERVGALPEVVAARAVAGFAAFGSEVDVDPLLAELRARSVQVHLPWVDGERLRLAAVADPSAELALGWRGVREPRDHRPVPLALLDAVIVPALAFDARGARLGYGGGHFDRLLGELQPAAVAIGVAFDPQIVDALPTDAHDRPVDVVVTERRVIRPRLPHAGTPA
jgi:5-formyltetrahydrofolate cyclo-ligase